MPCLDKHNAYAIDPNAIFFKDYKVDYDFTSTSSTALMPFNSHSPLSSYTSPSFTDETLNTPLPSTLSITIDLTKDDEICVDDPINNTIWPSMNSHQSRCVQQIDNRHQRMQNQNVLTVNPQDILPTYPSSPVSCSSFLPPQTKSIESDSSSSSRHNYNIPPSPCYDLVSQQSPVFYAAIIDYISTSGMSLRESSEVDGEEILRMQNTFTTVNPQHLGYSPDYITSPPPLRLCDGVEEENTNKEEKEEEEEIDELDEDPNYNQQDMNEFTIKQEQEQEHDDDDELFHSFFKNDYQNQSPSVLQSSPLSSSLQSYHQPISPYDSLGYGFSTKWQDFRGEVNERQYDVEQITRELTTGRQYYQTPKCSSNTIAAAGKPKAKSIHQSSKKKTQNEKGKEKEKEKGRRELGHKGQSKKREDQQGENQSLFDPNTGRARNACKNCHQRKMKCSVDRPSCLNCLKKGLTCEYPAFIRRRGKARNSHQQQNHQDISSPYTSPSLSPMLMPPPQPPSKRMMDPLLSCSSTHKKQKTE